MIEEAISYSIELSSSGSYSLEWTYTWLALRYFTEFAFTAIYFFTATLLFFRQPSNRMAIYLAFTFIALGIGQVTNGSYYLEQPLIHYFIYRVADVFSVFSAVYLFYVMPDGVFNPRWTRLAIVPWGIMTLVWTMFPNVPFNPLYGPAFKKTLVLSQIVFMVPVATGIYAQIQRWRRARSEEERQQVRWMLTGMLIMVIAGTVISLGRGRSFGVPVRQTVIVEVIALCISIGFPICLSIAVTRHRLWELNSFISQALVWGVMTAITISIFVLVVGGVGNLILSPSNPLLSAAATALVAILFQPARQRVQRFIDRYLFGLRDDPVTVISQITERNQSGQTPDRILIEIVTTVGQSLKLPYVCVELLDGNIIEQIVVFGEPVSEITRLDLFHQQQPIGYLVVGARKPGEVFNAADLRLLEMISWQVAALGHILHLNSDLQRSRERLVQVAERERQRLQRDLHDGLGTELTAQMLKIGTARAQVYRQPERADALLEDVEQRLVESVGEVRRLIHNLRPPVLEQLGLLKALELVVNEHQQRAFDIQLLAPVDLPRLPPAVETAAYRIVQEAVTNVAKHARASWCRVELQLDDALKVAIEDDGVGMSSDSLKGVGMNSMRERAEELGGHLLIAPRIPRGVRFEAVLPLPNSLLTKQPSLIGTEIGTFAS